jgi:hypothetical protein
MRVRHFIFGSFLGAVLLVAVSLAASGPARAAIDPGAVAVRPPPMSAGVSEVFKMFQNGIPGEIIGGYINSSRMSFYLSADAIIFLHQQGVPADVIMAMVNRNSQGQPLGEIAATTAAPAPVVAPAVGYPYAPVQRYPVFSPGYYNPYYNYPAGGVLLFSTRVGRVGGGFHAPVAHAGPVGHAGTGGGVRHVGGRR